MATITCICGSSHHEAETCPACRGGQLFAYWCGTCNRAVSSKRCPHCGLKAQRKKEEEVPRKGK